MNLDFAHLSLEEEDVEGIEVEVDVGEESRRRAEFCLVEKILTDKQIHFLSFKDRMANIWRPGKGVTITEWRDGIYIFQFYHSIDVDRVMEGGPWSYGNNLVVLHLLKEGEDPQSADLSKTAFWIQLHDIPVGYFSENLGRQMGNFIGEFLEFDPNNNVGGWRNYMKIRVMVDVSKPLKRKKKFRKSGGDSATVNFKYERLPIFCFICGRLGHGERYCSAVFDNPELIQEKGWGSWLRAAARRGTPVTENRWLVNPTDAQRARDSSMIPGPSGFFGNGRGNQGVTAAATQGRNVSLLNKEVMMGKSGGVTMVDTHMANVNVMTTYQGHMLASFPKANMGGSHVSNGMHNAHVINDSSSMELEENDDLTLLEDRKRKKQEREGTMFTGAGFNGVSLLTTQSDDSAEPEDQARRVL